MKYGMPFCFLVLGMLGAFAAGAQSPDAAARMAELRLEPGDRIAIHLVGEPDWSDTVMVTERREAAFPKLGVLSVAPFTIAQLQDTLRAQYARYLRNPALEIIVLRRVAVNGEVKNPDVYLVDVSTSLSDVIARAGGITDTGNRKKVYIVRNGERTRVANWESEHGSAGDLRSGDQVMVERKSWWMLNALPAVSTVALLVSVGFTLWGN